MWFFPISKFFNSLHLDFRSIFSFTYQDSKYHFFDCMAFHHTIQEKYNKVYQLNYMPDFCLQEFYWFRSPQFWLDLDFSLEIYFVIWDHDELYFGSALDEVEVRSVQIGYQFHFLTNENNKYKKKVKPYNYKNVIMQWFWQVVV